MEQPKQRLVVEIEPVVDGVGTKQKFYFATSGFSTKPTDVPANTHVAPRLVSAGSLRRELFSGNNTTGASRSTFGEIVLTNTDGALDDWKSYGISGSKVTVYLGDEDAAYPEGYTLVYIAYAQSMVVDFSTIRLKLRDRMHLLDVPLVTQTFAGTGGLEGTNDSTGKPKQWVSNDPYLFPPILLNYNLQLYYVQSTTCDPILQPSCKIYEGGIEITRGANYSSDTDLLSSSPASGQCRFWFGPGGTGPVYVRLGSVPVFDLRLNSFGNKPSSGSWNLNDLVQIVGINDIAVGSSLPVGALLVDDQRTIMQVIENACASFEGFAFMTRDDKFKCSGFHGNLYAPDFDTTPVYTFTEYNSKEFNSQPISEMDAPVYTTTINSGKRWPGNVATGATAEMKEQFQRQPWYSSFSRTNNSVKVANPGALSRTIDIEARDWYGVAGTALRLDASDLRYGVCRDFYECRVNMTEETLALELHDTVMIRINRFGLSSGRKFRIVNQTLELNNRTIRFGMWG